MNWAIIVTLWLGGIYAPDSGVTAQRFDTKAACIAHIDKTVKPEYILHKENDVYYIGGNDGAVVGATCIDIDKYLEENG